MSGIVSDKGKVTQCAALNPSVESFGANVGRVTGTILSGVVTGNIALSSMQNASGNTSWNNIGESDRDGESITDTQIQKDATLGGRFSKYKWKIENGKLPYFSAEGIGN